MSSRVGIVTISLNNKELMEQFVDEVKRQTYKNYQLYIVDNKSEESQLISLSISQLDWVTYIKNDENLGFTGGNNVGIQRALNDGCDYVWIVNNDVLLDPNCLSDLVGYFKENEDVGILGHKIYYEHDRDLIWYAGGVINWKKPYPFSVNTHVGERVRDEGQFDEVTETDFVTGASMLIRGQVLKDVALQKENKEPFLVREFFDDDYFMYFEDADLCLLAQRAGWKTVYYPKSVMWHMVGVYSSGGTTSPFSLYFQTRNGLLFVWRWGPWWAKFLALANMKLIILKAASKLLVPSRREYAKAQLRAVLDFVLNRLGKR